MKTVEQLAQDAMDKHIARGIPLRGVRIEMTTDAVLAMLTGAIEADRAQRAEATEDEHRFIVTVSGCDADQAGTVMGERLGYDEDYGFDYTLAWEVAT